jgi:hypothetical protein
MELPDTSSSGSRMPRSQSEYAADLRRATDKYVANGQESFKDDASMIKMYDDDAKDLYAIAALIDAGSFVEALSKSQRLDTVVRETIPDNVWDWLHS